MKFSNTIRPLKAYWPHLIIGPFFKLLEAILELLVPLIIADIVNQGIIQKNMAAIRQKGIEAFALACTGLACALICQYVASLAAQGYGTDLRALLSKKILSLSLTQAEKFGSQSLANRLVSDTATLQLAAAMLIRLVVRAPFISIGALVMAFILDWQLALVFVLVIPIFILVLYFLMSKSVYKQQAILTNQDRMSIVIQENIMGAREIRAFNSEKRRTELFKTVSLKLQELVEKSGKLTAWLNPLTMLILNLALIAVLWLGGIRINYDRLDRGQLIAMINYLTQVLQTLIVLANLVMLYVRAWSAAGRVEEVLTADDIGAEVNIGAEAKQERSKTQKLDLQNKKTRKQHELSKHKSYTKNNDLRLDACRQLEHKQFEKNSLSFSAVDFAYPESQVLLFQGLDFQFKTGVNAIIGPAGAGKSTIARLILNFYPISKGHIRANGLDLQRSEIGALSNLIGYVPQNPQLLGGTIEENMRMGKSLYSEEEIWHALALAQADDFVRAKRKGLQAEVVRGGRNFSGGQRQRLAIARALLKKPQILIFDDSTSALDYATDLSLRKAVFKDPGLAATIFIIISQRIANIRAADHIILLDDGSLIAEGTHEQLMATSGMYREMYYSQTDYQGDAG